jgi:hypothetical protein
MTLHNTSLEWLRDEQGSLDRALPLGRLQRPTSVDVIGGLVVYRFDRWDDYHEPGPRLLDRFRGLADGDDEAIRDFARDWGRLGVCGQGDVRHYRPDAPCLGLAAIPKYTPPISRPADAWVPPRPVASLLGGAWILGEDGRIDLTRTVDRCRGQAAPPAGYQWAEPLVAWRAYARFADDVLRLAAELHAQVRRPPADGLGADPLLSGVQPLRADGPPSAAWSYLQLWRLVEWWVETGDVRPGFGTRWPGWPTVELRGNGLFGALAMRLLLAVVQADHFVACSACGTAYPPTRWPREGERHFCPACAGSGARERLAKRDQRRRSRVGERLREVLPTLRVQARDEAELVQLLIEEARRAEPALPDEQLARVAIETLDPPTTKPTRGRKPRLARQASRA